MGEKEKGGGNSQDFKITKFINNIFISLQLLFEYIQNDLDDEVEYLHPTDDREASEEPHGSSSS